MRETPTRLPDPTLPAAAQWLKGIDRDYLHSQGWLTANKRFHGLALASRSFINTQFDDPAEQQAAFDGFTAALLALGHFQDIEELGTLFTISIEKTPTQD